ncbi:MAG TPA: hypothetical protein VL793_07900, partial [Patescibacteria group bacterium]|nr:hypothetical protein [Patescibacteria group bacterium]
MERPVVIASTDKAHHDSPRPEDMLRDYDEDGVLGGEGMEYFDCCPGMARLARLFFETPGRFLKLAKRQHVKIGRHRLLENR